MALLWNPESWTGRLAELEARTGDLKEAPLRRDVRSLGTLLGEVLREQAGDELFAHVEALRQGTIRRRDALGRLAHLLEQTSRGKHHRARLGDVLSKDDRAHGTCGAPAALLFPWTVEPVPDAILRRLKVWQMLFQKELYRNFLRYNLRWLVLLRFHDGKKNPPAGSWRVVNECQIHH